MAISLVSLLVATALALRKPPSTAITKNFSSCTFIVVRVLIIKENKRLDQDEMLALGEADRLRVEEAARLEGITFDQAMQRRKGFRYLY